MRLGRLGVNVGFDPVFHPADIAAAGFNLVRIVLQRHVPLHNYIDLCHAHDVQVLGTITNSSLVAREDGGERTMSFGEAAAAHAAEYANRLDYWQIGNESDRDPNAVNDGSWCMECDDCSQLITDSVAAIRAVKPDAYIIGPGLVTGQPDYPRGLDLSGLNAIAIHPYDQTPDSAQVLFEHNYKEFLDRGLRIFITEFGTPDPDPQARAAFLRDMVTRFQQLPYIEAAVWYCWAAIQNPRPFHVVDYDGQGRVVPTAVQTVAQRLGFAPGVVV